MSEPELDMNDPYEAHAVFALDFCCEKCRKRLPQPEGLELFSDPWYKELSVMAKKAGWYAPPAGSDGKMDVMSAWCPDCAKNVGSFETDWERP